MATFAVSNLRKMSVTILGIESSCDDTSAAVLRDTVLLSNVIARETRHYLYGGRLDHHENKENEY